MEPAHRAYLGVLAAALLTAIRFSPGRRAVEFKATAMDYLIIFVVVISLLAVGDAFQASVSSIIGLLVLLYVIELMLSERRQRRQGVGVASSHCDRDPRDKRSDVDAASLQRRASTRHDRSQ